MDYTSPYFNVAAERSASSVFMSSSFVNAPVALIIFNRPELTAKVFESIRQAQPTTLVVIADGARANRKGEAELCAAARAITEKVDWPCRVVRHYADQNLGCRNRVSSGLDLLFAEFDRAIILEDDCIPEPSFFRFCDELLERYKDDERVMAISGDNFQFGNHQIAHSYYFSRFPHVWGWATWRRAWRHYDVTMNNWPQALEQNWLGTILPDQNAVRYWRETFQAVSDGIIDTWDHQWTYACWQQNGLTALPRTNLISNIGFGTEATHTKRHSKFSKMAVEPLTFPLQHPPTVERDAVADENTQRQNFNSSLLGRARRALKRFLPR